MKEIYTVYKDTRNMSRAEWLAARKAGIGGSDAAAIIGLNPFSSPLTVWADKTSADEPQEESESEAIWLGNVLEDHVARRYAEQVSEHRQMQSDDAEHRTPVYAGKHRPPRQG